MLSLQSGLCMTSQFEQGIVHFQALFSIIFLSIDYINPKKHLVPSAVNHLETTPAFYMPFPKKTTQIYICEMIWRKKIILCA